MMRIIRDQQMGTLTLVPVVPEEEQVVDAIVAKLKPNDKLSYSGRDQDGDDGKFCVVHLHAGGHEEEKVETIGNTTLHRRVHVGSVELVLCGSTEEDKYQVNGIRNMCFFGTGGLIFLGATEVDGKKSIVTTGKRCKHCDANMAMRHECESETCDACAAKCDHVYKRGMTHGPHDGPGIGWFCSKCGRGKPLADGEREESAIEQHLKLDKELGIKVIYKGPPFTPQDAVKVARVARGHKKAKARSAK
jgi:hypothetical protein